MRKPRRRRWRNPPPERHRPATSHEGAAAMKAMRFVSPGAPLVLTEVSLPSPRGHELLIRVQACGVCRTDLHLLDGELPAIPFPVTPGHEIVGTVAALGPEASEFRIGDRVGVPWLAFTCGECLYCRSSRENLCERARFTGYTRDGGYAEQVRSDERPGEWLDAAILFAPVGALVPAALGCVRPGGCVVCAGIHMSDVPAFPYRLLWGERSVSSVANLTRADGREFLSLAARLHLKATVQRFALGDANLALERLRSGALEGAAVLELPEA